MAKLPAPPGPGGLARRLSPAIHRLAAGTTLWRIYRQAGAHPTSWDRLRHWGPVRTARFDHHEEPARDQARGILYGALRVYTCFAEFFQETRVIERTRDAAWLVAFQLVREVALLDLTGAWPTRAGASMAINSGRRDRARAWSRRIYEDYPALQGLWYASSMDSNKPAVALYERAQDALPPRPVFHRALGDPVLDHVVAGAALSFNYLIAP